MLLETSSTAITLLHPSKTARRAVAIGGAEDCAVQLKTKIWWNLIRPDRIHRAPTRGVNGALHEQPPPLWVQQSGAALETYSKRPMELARHAAKPTWKPCVQTSTALLVMAATPADEKGLVLRLVEAATKAPCPPMSVHG